MKSAKTYQDGAIGMIQWCNDFVWIPVYPEGTASPVWTRMGELPNTPNKETGKSYDSFWKEQHEVLHEALEMNDGRFKHRLIVFCWERGEGKSALACLVQMWKFFNFPRQQIVLGANSKDQVKFVHFDIIKDMVLNLLLF